MVKSVSSKPKLIIDSCFWINVVYLNLEKYLLEFFELYFVSKVEDEIVNKQNIILYEANDIKLFNKLKENKLINIVNPKNISKVLLDNLQSSSGELYSIAYSIENNILLATDNNGLIVFCRNNKLKYITTIDFLIFLKSKIKLDINHYFNLMSGRIKQKYIEEGKKYIKNVNKI